MQGLGVAAHDAIEQERSLSAEARLGGSPRASQLRAAPREPQAHTGPTLIERELGEELHPDHTARLGHPGVDCHHLPAGHAHRWGQLKGLGGRGRRTSRAVRWCTSPCCPLLLASSSRSSRSSRSSSSSSGGTAGGSSSSSSSSSSRSR